MGAVSLPRVLSGIQPTADSFHLGNYLGALRQWVSLQESTEAFYCIVDLHAITVAYDPMELRDRVYDTAATFDESRKSYCPVSSSAASTTSSGQSVTG